MTMQISFLLFLAAPVTYQLTIHIITTVGFSLLGSLHLSVELCHGVRNIPAIIIIVITIGALLSVFFPFFDKSGYIFWAVECTSLSGFALFTPALMLFGTHS
jgi:hypothetical protein